VSGSRSAGRLLSERLARGALPLRAALDLGRQAARAVSAAHAAGRHGLDLAADRFRFARDGSLEILPALDAAESARGASAGAGGAAYPAPEQLRGEPSDARADLFALGCVLYEMVSGRPPFSGATRSERDRAILEDDPSPLAASRPGLPAGLEALILHCLEKDPALRFQSAASVAFAIEQLGDGSFRPLSRPPVGRWMRALAIPLLAAALGAAAFAALERRGADPPQFQQITFRRGFVSNARFAPDGRTIVYSAGWDGEPLRLFTARTEGPGSQSLPLPDAGLMGLSPTGELAIGLDQHYFPYFFQGSTLARVPLGGHVPERIAGDVGAAEWSPDGRLAIVRRAGNRTRLEFPAGHVLYETDGWISHPRFSHDGTRIAFFDHPQDGDDRGAVAIVDLRGRLRRLTTVGGGETGLAWGPHDREIWFASNRDEFGRELHAVDMRGHMRVLMRFGTNTTVHDVSNDGALLLTRETIRMSTQAAAPGRFPDRDLSYLDYSLSTAIAEDGSRVVISEQSAGAGPLYAACVRDMDGSPPVRLGDGNPTSISRDGRLVLTILPPPYSVMVVVPTHAGIADTLPRGGITTYRWGTLTPDGRRVVFTGYASGQPARTFVQSVSGGPARPVTPSGVVDLNGDCTDLVTPDGRFVTIRGADSTCALYSLDDGPSRTVRGLHEDENPIQWSADGRWLIATQPGRPGVLELTRIDPASGERHPWMEIRCGDLAGLVTMTSPRVTPDGKAYAYTVLHIQSVLYRITGLR
jgi:hypothetical protein